jgi:hypothetical protein
MDTDDLSIETYNAIIMTSEKFDSDLTLQFGLLAEKCGDDNDYLIKAKKLIADWRGNLDFAQEDIFFGERKSTNVILEKVLIKIEKQINLVLEIPIENRKFEF